MKKPDDAARQVQHESKREFSDAHDAGMEALQRHDYDALAQAIAAESAAIEKHKNAVEHLQNTANAVMPENLRERENDQRTE